VRRGAKQRIDVDVDMDSDSRVPQATASPRIRREDELFSKRLPTSPMLLDTPRKPRPPARPLGRTTPKLSSNSNSKSCQQEEDDDDDPLSLSFSSPDVVALSPLREKDAVTSKGSGKKKKRSTPAGEIPREPNDSAPAPASAQSGSAKLSRRRVTLDEEMRDARARFILRDDQDLQFLDDLDSEILVGVGTRSKKRGFLAHGGAGGLPVFMGDGYVEGVEESDSEVSDEVDGDYEPSKERSVGGRGRRESAAASPVLVKKNRRQ
jgi:hypothetical protein